MNSPGVFIFGVGPYGTLGILSVSPVYECPPHDRTETTSLVRDWR